MKTKIIILLAFLLLAGKMFAETHVTAGTINANTTWSIGNSPYFVDGDIIIADGANTGEYKTPTLTIEPGVQVVFTGYYKITVRGTLKAKGTAVNKIVFRKGATATENLPTDTTGLANLASTNGGWHGIHWDNEGAGWSMWDNDSSIMEYCVFKYSKTITTTGIDMNGGAVRINWGDDFLRFSNCEFLYNCAFGNGGALSNYGSLHVNNCTFKYNKSGYKGGAVYIDSYSPVFSKCIFQYNTSLSDGGAFWMLGCNSLIVNSYIINNYAAGNGGAIMFDESNDYLANNIIANNKSAQSGTLLINNSSPVFVNNTIANNQFNWASCITYWSFSASKFYNTIFWGNKDILNNPKDIFLDKPTSIPEFQNCLIAESAPAFAGVKWVNNINADPQFISATADNNVTTDAFTANWRLQESTQAVNKGIENSETAKLSEVDIYGKSRRQNGLIDIGAVETHIGKIIAARNIDATVYWNADTVLVTTDSVIIGLNGKVIIAPGTKVIFTTQAPIINYGAIIAKGTDKLHITFAKRLSDTAGFSNLKITSGGWGGIVMDNEYFGAKGTMTQTSEFEYCDLMYAKKINLTNASDHDGGAFSLVYFSKVNFNYCRFLNNIGFNGGALFLRKYSNPVIDHCTFANNQAINGGGALSTAIFCNPLIKNCLFTNNNTNESGGAIWFSQGQAVFYNNIICNNTAKNDGGGVYGLNTNNLFINNTIVNNEANYGGGVNFYTGGSTFYNTVFWGNNARASNGGDQIIMNLSKVNFYNCNISTKNSPIGSYMPDVGWAWYGDTSNLISKDPFFIKSIPIGGNGLLADYGITDYSGNINKGALSVPNFVYSDSDFYNKSRINEGKIDIGAIENQGSKIVFIKQPIGKSLCLGDSINLSVEVTDPTTIQWQKDGLDLAGSNMPILKIKNISDKFAGAYQCRVSNAYGTVYSNSVMLLGFLRKPTVDPLKSITYIDGSSTTEIAPNSSGDEPLAYQWYKNGILISGKTQNNLVLKNIVKTDEALYKCRIGNICDTITTNETNLVIAPQICMVGNLNQSNNKNVIIWDRNSINTYDHYNVYRESSVKNKFDKIGIVPYAAITTYADTAVNPKSQAFMYKITAVDANGKETDINATAPHKTIHLLVTLGVPEGLQLDWDDYIGFEYGTYDIYRSIDNAAFTKLYSMSSTSRTYTDFSAPNTKNLRYYVSVTRSSPCLADKLAKSGAGPFASAISNMEDNSRLKFTATNVVLHNIKGVEAYPNPFGNYSNLKYTLEQTTDVRVVLTDFAGREIKTIVTSTQLPGTYSYQLGNDLQVGIYYLKVTIGKELQTIKIVKIK